MDLFKNQVQAKVSLSGPMWGFGVFMDLPWIKGLPGSLKFRAPAGLQDLECHHGSEGETPSF